VINGKKIILLYGILNICASIKREISITKLNLLIKIIYYENNKKNIKTFYTFIY